jgi:hypothetical protein
MEYSKLILLYDNSSDKIEYRFNYNNIDIIKNEITKFICYCSDFNMLEYIATEIKYNRFKLKDCFFLYRLKEKELINRIMNDNLIYTHNYILDFYHKELTSFNYEKSVAYKFSYIADYPYK